MAFFTRDETEIIRVHRFDTTCWVLAEHGACLDLKTQEVRKVTGRRMVPVTANALPRHRPTSWFLAAILCPGDTTDSIAAWAMQLKPGDWVRIVFYEAEGVEAQADEVFRGWTAKNLPDPVRRRVAGLEELTKALGRDLNRRILRDHQGPSAGR